MEDTDVDMEGGSFPTTTVEAETVEFGWESDLRASGGRRKKREREAKKRTKPGTFGAMGLSPQLYRNITHVCKFKLPTPIQRKSIPLVLQGLDLVGMARTGSGKTAAFAIPILQRLKEHSTTVGARCLIVSPSRELALQTYAVMTNLGKGMGLRIAVVVGGDSISDQFMQLAANPDIVLATPGRLVHLLSEVKDFTLQSVEVAVFDEADRLFEMGFADQICEITRSMPGDRQTLLFSATMPRLLADFAKSGLHDPEIVRLDAESTLSPDLALHFFTVREEDKSAALLFLIKRVIAADQASIVFCSTKHHVAFLHQLLQSEGTDSAFVYGNMDQSARKIQVAKFRTGTVSVLFVTDVAARGVDLPIIENVVHFDFPASPKLFVHRSGRTARAGKTGTAYSLLASQDLPYLLDLHLFLSKPVAAAREAVEERATVFGALPTYGLSLLSDVVQRRVHDSEELQGLLRSLQNGFKLYLKTRQPASSASVRRAKKLPQASVHPLFSALHDSSLKVARALLAPATAGCPVKGEKEREAFSRQLKAFRPSQSVFEAPVAQNRHALKAGADAEEVCLPVLKASLTLGLFQEPAVSVQGPELTLGAYRDAAFYIPYERGDRHAEAGFSVHSKVDRATMDLMGEDQEGLVQQKRQFHWDKRGRRYVCLPQGERVKGGKRVRTESGAKVMKGKETGKIYDAWARNQKAKIQAAGAQEDARLTRHATGALEVVGQRHRERNPGREPKGEDMPLPEQIKKQKRIKARQRWKNMPKEKRNKAKRGRVGKQSAIRR